MLLHSSLATQRLTWKSSLFPNMTSLLHDNARWWIFSDTPMRETCRRAFTKLWYLNNYSFFNYCFYVLLLVFLLKLYLNLALCWKTWSKTGGSHFRNQGWGVENGFFLAACVSILQMSWCCSAQPLRHLGEGWAVLTHGGFNKDLLKDSRYIFSTV